MDRWRIYVEAIQKSMSAAIDAAGDELEALSHRIHSNPELGYKEVKASGWLVEFLEANGYKVEAGAGGVPTAFRGTLETGHGPTIAIMCEYDALPGIGHACGHNAIAAAGAGAALGLAAVQRQLPAGRICIIGTPAEEGGGGKVKLVQAGLFRGVDAAMMIHGWDAWIPHQDLLGIVRLSFEFSGKAAHASADPWSGVNALDAVIQTFNNVSMLRQQILPQERIHGIVTNGGSAPNIIPETASALFYVRSPGLEGMWKLSKRVEACAEGAARATGCDLKVTVLDTVYEPFRRNPALVDAFRANMRMLGIQESPEVKDRLGSSDVGNISQVVPTIQPLVQIAPRGTPIHSRPFETAAASPLAREGILKAAKVMAMTTVDLLADADLLARCRKDFAGHP
ncbi:MAG: M20 family metallopeptidase [Thermoplasmatota archaeon]